MILKPAIIALLSGAFLITLLVTYASIIGLRIISCWDLQSGSEQQLILERKTYLVSTIVSYVLVLELFSLFLFVYTADDLHSRIVGAMCAAGALNGNVYGYPTLLLKIFNFCLSTVWLVVNYADNRAFDYPLIRTKYKLLLFIAASLVLETFLQTHYFLNLQNNVITSCCSRLFGENGPGLAGDLAALPSSAAKFMFYSSLFLTLRTGIHFYFTGRAARLFSALALWSFVLSFVAVVSFISVYYYELPTHHCPFCLLQRQYGHIGYALYLPLFAAGGLAAAVGALDRFKNMLSLKSVIPILQKRLCLASLAGYILFVMVSSYPIVFSDFRLEGY